ncbi:Piwi domain-containing protein [Deinococcus arcticus]|uniref:Piwi domain-containing protein n=1 Tax=Deinococcus arcticus TaxID=2136176 RepID=UPI001304BFAD|nr:Piwi domain-containing protein [Deinococcus arcticus]
MSDLNLSGDAHHCSALSMAEVRQLVQLPGLWQPFVTSLEPLEVDGKVIEGQRLRFGRGFGRDVTEVHKRGILTPPPLPVRLLVVPPELEDLPANQQLRQELLAHLLPREVVLRHPDASEGLRKHLNRRESDDTLYSFWSAGDYRKLGLEPFDLVKGLHKYESTNGRLLAPEELDGVAAEADRAGRQLIGLVILSQTMRREERDALFGQLGRLGVSKLLPISREMLNRPRSEYMAWVNVAVKLAQKAGAIPWDVVNLPGITERTFFVGVDLGHDHREGKSVPAFSLHEFRGRPVNCVTLRKRVGNERLSLGELKEGFSKLLRGKRPDQVVVHRDGRFLDGEVDDFMIALNDLGIPCVTLLAVKKSNLSMVADAEEGTVLALDSRRCLLVTNTQSVVARPTELEVMHSDRADLSTLTEQVFWLTRVFMNNAQHAGGDPSTVEWANGIARTGKRVPLAGWRA